MDIKIIFCDIDEIKLEEKIKVKKIFRQIQEKNVLVVFISNHERNFLEKEIDEYDVSPYCIALNGTDVYDFKKKKKVYEQFIPEDIVKKISDYCKNLKIDMKFQTSYSNALIYNKINQIKISSNNYDRMLVIPSLFKEKFSNIKIVNSSLDIKSKKGYYHEIVYGNVTKKTGILELMDYLKINYENALIISRKDDNNMLDNIKILAVNDKNLVEILNDILKEVMNNEK